MYAIRNPYFCARRPGSTQYHSDSKSMFLLKALGYGFALICFGLFFAPPVHAEGGGDISLNDTAPLFYPLDAEWTTKRAPQHAPWVTGHCLVHLDLHVLMEAAAGKRQQIHFNVLGEDNLIGTIKTKVVRSARDFTLCGCLNENELNEFTLSICGDAVIGSIHAPSGRNYEIGYRGKEIFEIREVDNTQISDIPSYTPTDQEASQSEDTQRYKIRKSNDDGSTIDIMIIYTPMARTNQGGTEAMEALINLSVDQTNIAFGNSTILPRLRLVHQQEVAYTEASAIKYEYPDDYDFDYLNRTNDPYLNEVHTWRNEYGADLVCFINGRDGGKGNVLRSLSPSFERSAFTIVGYSRAASDYTLAHEVGHNLGCNHAVGDQWSENSEGLQRGGNVIYNYAYGWRFEAGGVQYRTIMAYRPGTIIAHYSNPNVYYQGVRTGVPLGDPEEADNARTINQTCLLVSNFRSSIPGPSAPMNLTASYGTSDKVILDWQPVAGATHYRVYRAQSIYDVPLAITEWIEATNYEDGDIPINMDYLYWVQAAKSNTGSLSGSLSESVSGWRKLSAPSRVTATDGNYSDRVVITWGSVAEATHYRISRAESGDGPKTALSGWITVRNYTDVPPESQKGYYYYVQAAKGADGISAGVYSESESGWRKMLAPQISASDGTSAEGIDLQWSARTDATHYRVYRSLSTDGTKTPITDWQTALSYQDRDVEYCTIYYYWLMAATNSYGFDGTEFSQPDSGWRALAYPAAPYASDGSNEAAVSIGWDAIDGANYYRVYRSTSSSPSLATHISNWITQTSYDDTSAMPGETYYYFVEASTEIDSSYATGLSSGDSGWRKYATPEAPDASDGLYMDRIHVTWSSVWGATYYRLYRASSPADTPIPITPWRTQQTYDDTSVVQGENVYYWVQAAANSSGKNPSDLSPMDGGSTGITPPKNVVATNGTESNKVVIQWSRLQGTYYYQVYRSDTIDGEKKSITGWVQQAERYDDGNARAGEIYYYWVKVSSDANGTIQSAFSNSDIGYRYLPPPTGVTASDGVYLGMVHVEWDSMEGATHYMVFRADGPNESPVLIQTWQQQTYFEDTDVVAGHTYYYTVKSAGNSSGAGISSPSQANGGFSMLPPPYNVAASNGAYSSKIRVTWQSSEEAYYFQIFRSDSPDGEAVALNELARITYFDDTDIQPGRFYYYRVKAARGSTGYGETNLSEADMGWLSPPTPEHPTASDFEYPDKVVVTWKPLIEGLYYQVYRAAQSGGEKIAVSGWQTDLVFEDTGTEPGIMQYYYLRASGTSQGTNPSEYSMGNGGTRTMTPPASIWTSQGIYADKVQVTWGQVDNAIYYQLYRSESLEGEKTPVTDWQRLTRHEDTEVNPYTVYYYWVKAARGFTGYGQTEFSLSNQGWLKCDPPAEITASDGTHSDQIHITWDPVAPNLFYRVYRSDSIYGDQTPLADWQPSVEYSDTGTQPGQTHYYWISTAFMPDGAGAGDFSMPDTGWRYIEVPDAPGNPAPADGATDVLVGTDFDWTDCQRADFYNVRIWITGSSEVLGKIASEPPPNPEFNGLEESSLQLSEPLEPGISYSWQAFAWNMSGKTAGPVWQFTTKEEDTSVQDWMLH